MIAWLNDLFAGSSDFMPHGNCYLWLPSLLWLHVIADSIIAVAYYSIPFALFYFVKKRIDLAYRWVFVLFAIFICLCGTTHLISIWTIWHPDYWLDGLLKLATALVSIITALLIWRLIPKLLQLPSPQALQNSETYLRAVFNATPDAMIISDEQGIITMVNEQTERLLGYPPDELLGLSIEVLVPEHTRMAHPGGRAQFVAAGKSRLMGSGKTVKVLCKDKTELDVEISLSPIKTAQGLFFASALRDITERIRAQQALEYKEQMLSESQRIAHIGSWSMDLTTGQLSWSDEMYQIYDVTPETFDHSIAAFFGLIHHDDREEMVRWISDCQAEKKPAALDFKVTLKDSKVLFIHGSGGMQYDERGKPIRIVGSAKDITERKQAEWLSNKLNAMIEVSLDGFWIVDMMGKIQQVNEAYSRMMGYSVDELLNMHVSQLDDIDGPEQVKARIEKIIAQNYVQFESRHRHKDGHTIEVEVSIAFLPDFQQMCAFFRDITERKQYEEKIRQLSDSELNKAKLEAEKASQAKSDFLSSMSHELRTPMNAVLGFAQLLDDDDLTEDQHDSVKEILTAGYHLVDLINEVLDLSKIESETLELKLEEFDLAVIVQNCLTLVKPLTAKNSIKTINNLTNCSCRVIADVLHLKQVLLNLISNAIKYNHIGGSLTLSCEVVNPQLLRINVADTGNGLSEQQLSKLFQPFERLSAKNSNIEGTGIGLVISKKLIEAMGGKIGVDSVVGEGSCFWVEIPLA